MSKKHKSNEEWTDEEILELAERYGVVYRVAGIKKRQLERLVADGKLLQISTNKQRLERYKPI